MKLTGLIRRIATLAALGLAANLLVACAGGGDKAKPAELTVNTPKLGIRLAWATNLGTINFPLNVAVSGANAAENAIFTVANNDGVVTSFDATNGRQIWRAQAGKPLAAGVGMGSGAQASYAAVVTNSNELIVFNNGSEIWRIKLGNSSYTPPLVANGNVFVLGADRAISAFVLVDGKKLWSQKKSTEALTLRQTGVLLMVSDTLVSSASGRLVGINTLDGSVRWSTPIATARGTNEIERLVDLVGRVSSNGEVICARAHRVTVGCVNTLRGNLLWTKPAVGQEGVQADATTLFGSEADGKVIAWNRVNGERLWQAEQLLNRNLSTPAVLDKAVAVGDSIGFIHFLSKTDGSSLNRMTTDGSAIAAAPVVVGNTLVVVTRNGGVFGFITE